MINKRTFLLILLVIGLIASILIALLLPYQPSVSGLRFRVIDQNDNYHFEVNERLQFMILDTTPYTNKKAIWHFGNGDTIKNSFNPTYKYKKDGTYLVTLEIDGKYKEDEYIDIVIPKQLTARDSVSKILAPSEAFVNEKIVFNGISEGATSWSWEFGETGSVDAYDAQAIYIYKEPGNYNVVLKTNNATYPVYHRIRVMPSFESMVVENPIDSLQIVGQDIQKHLQAIADAKTYENSKFYKSFNHIKKQYSCNTAEDLVMVVNGKYDDFYSYCQGLHYLSRKNGKNVVIENVVVDTVGVSSLGCLKKIIITQTQNTNSN